MQNKTYTDLLALIRSLIGATELTPDEQSKVLNFVNRRAYEAYNTSPSWSRYLVSSEERNVSSYKLSGSDNNTVINQNYRLLGQQNDADSKNVYEGMTTTDTRIYHNGTNWVVATDTSFVLQSNGKYTKIIAGNVIFTEGDSPSKNKIEDVESWTTSSSDVLSVSTQSLIPYAQTSKNTVGEFLRIHRKKAFINNSALEYEFFVDSEGANLLNSSSSEEGKAFVTYKKQITEFSDTSTDIPLEFFYFLAHASFADFLRLESKYEDARTEEAIAQSYLAQELEKIDLKNNNNSLNKKFSTYVNRQSR